MKAQKLVLSLLVVFIFSTGLSLADMVDFEAQPYNASYGAAYFHSPNDLIFVEDGVLVFITNYYNNGNQYFNFGRIKDSLPAPANFHYGHIFQLNNVGAIFDFSGPGDASFEFVHFGGKVNLEVNSSGILVADHFSDLAGNVAPGITLSVSGTSFPGGHKGTVTLTGDVDRLLIGGQEMYIDEVSGGGNLPTDDCDFIVSHESLSVGQVWGGDYGNSPGEGMFVEDGIKVYCEEFSYGGGDFIFGESQVVITPHPSFGFQRVMEFSKFANLYTIDSLEITTAAVSFEILSYGGVHNLQVNDGPLFVDEFPNMPTEVDSDVSMVVDTFPFSGGYRALVVLTGNVHTLLVGGESVYLDNLCVTQASAVSAAPGDLLQTPLKVDGNFPNPFNPSTSIAFTTEFNGSVELSVIDLAGHRVATLVDQYLAAGSHEARWNGRTTDGRKAPTAVYFVQLRSGNQTVSRKITMVK